MFGKDSGDLPELDPAIRESLARQTQQGDALLKLVGESYADNKARLATQDALNQSVINSNLSIADKAGQRADDAYALYQSAGRPMVEKALKDANEWDSEANRDEARGRAVAGAQQQFDTVAGQQSRELMRLGINPNSGRFAALQTQLQAQRALAAAGAGTAADESRRVQGVQLRQGASNLALAIPGQSQQFTAQQGGALGAASTIAGRGLDSSLAIGGQAMGGYGSAAGIYGSGAQGYQTAYNSNLQRASIQNQNDNAGAAGFGRLVGTIGGAYLGGPLGATLGGKAVGGIMGNDIALGYSDGGEVDGAGTSTSDSVPARLSDGEFVMSADVVRAKGTEFFERLQQKYHKPTSRSGNLMRMAA
jgi:hypothetical protein